MAGVIVGSIRAQYINYSPFLFSSFSFSIAVTLLVRLHSIRLSWVIGRLHFHLNATWLLASSHASINNEIVIDEHQPNQNDMLLNLKKLIMNWRWTLKMLFCAYSVPHFISSLYILLSFWRPIFSSSRKIISAICVINIVRCDGFGFSMAFGIISYSVILLMCVHLQNVCVCVRIGNLLKATETKRKRERDREK